MQRLVPSSCAVVIVDVQEKLARAMPAEQLAALTRAGSILVEAARLLGARVIATEQYPQGLGPTIAALAEPLARAGAPVISKLDFSACDEPAFVRALTGHEVVQAPHAPRAPGRAPGTAIVLGMEAHVCVFQTVRELRARGIAVHVPIDGVASRRDDHREAGLALCRDAGAVITTAETIAFDWLGRAGSDEFRALSKLIR